MLRYTLMLVLVLGSATPAWAGGNNWAERLFEGELAYDFGAVPHGQMLVHYFRIVNNTLPSTVVRVYGTKVSCGLCTSAEVLNKFLAPGQETFVRTQLDSRLFSGDKEVTIDVMFDMPNRETARLRLHAISNSELTFFPDHLNFAKIEKGTTPSKEMTITFSRNPQVEITDAKCSSSYIQPAVQVLRRDNTTGEVIYQLSATIQADIPAGSWYTDIWLATNHPSMPKLRVPLAVEVEPKLVAFQAIKAGDKTSKKITLDAKQPFRIISISGADQDLAVSAASNGSQTSHELILTFQTRQVGLFQRLIRVTTDMPNNTEIEFKAQAQIIP